MSEPDLNPEVRPKPLAPKVARDRLAHELECATQDAVFAPRIEAHLEVCASSLAWLESVHRGIADNTDLQLDGLTRPAAVWMAAGRCISLTGAMLTLLESGFAAETVPTTRAIHELTRLLSALADRDEDDLLRKWLKDEWIKTGQANAARVRWSQRLQDNLEVARDEALATGDHEAAAQFEEGLTAGADPDELLSNGSGRIYGGLSTIAHNRRSAMLESFSKDLRMMALGPHPEPATRSVHVDFGTLVVNEVVRDIGQAFAECFFGPAYFGDRVKPWLDRLDGVRAAQPLS